MSCARLRAKGEPSEQPRRRRQNRERSQLAAEMTREIAYEEKAEYSSGPTWRGVPEISSNVKLRGGVAYITGENVKLFGSQSKSVNKTRRPVVADAIGRRLASMSSRSATSSMLDEIAIGRERKQMRLKLKCGPNSA